MKHINIFTWSPMNHPSFTKWATMCADISGVPWHQSRSWSS